ncbi:MAG: hypothetical protein HXY39_20240 [Chloroflexi bacterium]|nr:hypothetical protein [Chloroflexota bacterium]
MSGWWTPFSVAVALVALAAVVGVGAQGVGSRPEGGDAVNHLMPIAATGRAGDPVFPFYGTQYVPVDELPVVRRLGFTVVLNDFAYDDGPAEWIGYLDAAHAQQLKVVAWLWPEGWTLDRRTGVWTIDPQTQRFLRSVAGHPALFAVYGLHEPYWNECDGCGYTTAQQQALYRAIKAISPVPVYSEINGFAFWAERGSATTIAPGVCDYCQTAFYPFMTDGSYKRKELIAHIQREIDALRRHAPTSRLIWTMPSMSHVGDQLRMPTADEMRDYARLVYAQPEIAGAWWYPWRWDNDLYPDYLAKHPELFPAVCEIARTIIAPARPTATPTSTMVPRVTSVAARCTLDLFLPKVDASGRRN